MILLYRGKSFVSWRIKMATLSPYSHAAWLKTTPELRELIRTSPNSAEAARAIIEAGCIEAWHIGPGVRETFDLHYGHSEGTVIDVFDLPELPDDRFSLVEAGLRQELGKSYWFSGILNARFNCFLNRKPPMDSNGIILEWFCSMIIEHWLRLADFPTCSLRRPAWGVWPGMFETSVHTKYLCSVKI
ncbi:MAG TPA: hypothetical protein PKI68_01020 [Pontiellaceae bacterium]|nr:hypothetical protein [Pontiellaceae bacterium]